MNDYFDQVYVINLQRQPEKLTKVLWGLNRLKCKVKVIEAVDGYHPNIYIKRLANNSLSAGAYGYLLSWGLVLNDALEHQYDKILILDDDVVLCNNFNDRFNTWIQTIDRISDARWKIILLGATQHAALDQNDIYNTYYRPRLTDGSFAVGLQSSEIIQDIYDCIDPERPLYLDSDILRKLYVDSRYAKHCYVAYPNLIIADVTSSDIRQGRNQQELANKIGWTLADYQYPLTKPLVSIIVPCYNAEKTINRCLHSLLSQTYRPLEIIIINDSSTDDTYSLLTSILQKWEYNPKAKGISTKFVSHHYNKGCYASRNAGLKLATGDIIGFQDADDISLDYRIEDQVNALLAHNVLLTTCLILRTHLKRLAMDPVKLLDDIKATRVHEHKYCCKSKVGLVTTLFRREVFDKYGLYPEVKWGADATYLERIFPDVDMNMMNYLNECTYIPNMYYKVNEILYLSHEMTKNNLTIQRLRSNA